MTPRRLLPWVALALVAAPLGAQGSGCYFLAPTEEVSRTIQFGQQIQRVISPNIRCDDGRMVQAEEMVTYESSALTVFSGNVFFQDEHQTLRAFSANYYEREGRLEASGNVELVDLETGTEISGLSLVYLRGGFMGRVDEVIRVYGGRPRALLYPRATPPDSLPAPPLGEGGQPVAFDSTGAPIAADAAGDSIRDAAADSLGTADSLVAGDSTPAADSTSGLLGDPQTTDAPADSATGIDLPAPAPADTVPPEPYEVFGQEIEIRGNDWFRARGEVQILRDSMDARADSLEYVQSEGRLYLDGNAFVDQPTLDLSAREIMILLPGDVISDLIARGDGRLLGDRIDLAAPYIRVELDEGEVQGLWAAPLYRGSQDSLDPPLRTALADAEPDSADYDLPIAVSDAVLMTGDSLDVRAPGQVLERVIAIGRARAVSSARDSLNTEDTPALIRDDWIEGDTVVAVFVRREVDPAAEPAPDSLGAEEGPSEFVLDRLEATGSSARSLYRLLPADDAEPGPMTPTGADSTVVFGDPDAGADSIAPAAPPLAADSLAAGDSVAAGDSMAAGADSAAAPAPEPRRLAIHYVVARRIVIRMEDGQVRTMEVTGLERGMHQEPTRTNRPPAGASGGGGATPPAGTGGTGGGGDR